MPAGTRAGFLPVAQVRTMDSSARRRGEARTVSASRLQLTGAAALLVAAIACGALAGGPAHAQARTSSPVAGAGGEAGAQATNRRGAVKKKVRASRQANGARKPPLVRKHRRAHSPPPAAKAPTKRPQSSRKAAVAAVAVPARSASALPPLGPERFYPDGIPELHPAFMHPLPGTPVLSEPAAVSRAPGAEPEWLP